MGKLRKRVVVSVMVVSGVATLLGLGSASAGEAEAAKLPEGIRGFKGMMVGTVVSKTADAFVLKVAKITRTWRESKATSPASVVGKEIPITLWGKSRLVERHQSTLAGLKSGDRVKVEAFHLEGDRLSVVEALKKIENGGAEEPKPDAKEAEAAFPEGIAGFRGMLVGTLEEKGDTFFSLKVEAVKKTWKGSTATSPASMVGKRVKITLRREGRVNERFVAALAEMMPRDRVEVGTFHVANDILACVEWLKKAE